MRSFDEIMRSTHKTAQKAKQKNGSSQRKPIDLGPGMPVNGSYHKRHTHDISEAIRRAAEG